MKKPPANQSENPVGKAIFDFVNILMDIIEEERGKYGLIGYFIEISLYHTLTGTTYNKKGQLIDLKRKGKVIKME